VRRFAPACRNDVGLPSPQVPAGDVDEALLAQVVLDEVFLMESNKAGGKIVVRL
jgi:hypothetical protein